MTQHGRVNTFKTLIILAAAAAACLATPRNAVAQLAYATEVGSAPALLALAELPTDRPLAAVVRGEVETMPATAAKVPATRAVAAALAPASSEEITHRTLVAKTLERAGHLKAIAWPSVREYVWTRCFEGSDLFEAYSYAQPGGEQQATVTFSLYLNEDVWSQLDAEAKARALTLAKAQFVEALGELGIDGHLQIMTANGMS